MGTSFEGRLVASTGQRFAIVVARFNELFTKQLLDGALAAFRRHGVAEADVDVAWVPGSFEVPPVAKRLASSGRYAAVVCLGAVIRGATSHYDYVAGQAASGVAHAALDTGIPVIFGIITTETLEQAMDRSGAKSGNKGYEAAITAIEMADLMAQLPAPQALSAKHPASSAPAK
ncbi:MAG: 6,7-dimethyl-8-ribityllumazine synthase [uncultured Chloroflexi bacterium]|uniref:6,7-dimethyl-8-ribityllumazine synthase n=1 Tax=uncultured Chloroflexota bacterium TaxID=166587 RepID=A0A6J4IQU5_9CHLR|nr:MAG: 6,7-dimethyl-8-ribityllumazine synthase [uncultured Chloroflexota bacterium]